MIGQDSIAAGSVLTFVSDALDGELGRDTAIVLANLGQLLWWRKGKKALTLSSWNALPRKNGVSGGVRLDPIKNRVKGHKNVEEHVESVFDFINKKMRKDAKVDIIGLSEGGEEAVKFLDSNWDSWKDCVRAVCVGLGFVWHVGDEVKNPAFKEFWAKVRMSFTHSSPRVQFGILSPYDFTSVLALI